MNLSENNIGSDGIRSVAEMLSVNESITELVRESYRLKLVPGNTTGQYNSKLSLSY